MGRAFLSLLLFLPLLAHAQMYKCVDARGAVQYTDEPRPGCKPAAIRASPPISGEVRKPEEDFATRDAQFKRRQIEQRSREAQEARQRQALEQRCAQLRREQGVLTSGVRVVASIKPDGERVYMDDAAREQRLAGVRDQLRSCP